MRNSVALFFFIVLRLFLILVRLNVYIPVCAANPEYQALGEKLRDLQMAGEKRQADTQHVLDEVERLKNTAYLSKSAYVCRHRAAVINFLRAQNI